MTETIKDRQVRNQPSRPQPEGYMFGISKNLIIVLLLIALYIQHKSHEFYMNFARDKTDSMAVLYELNKNLVNRGYIPQTRIEKDDSNICELTEEDLKKIQENLKPENPLEL